MPRRTRELRRGTLCAIVLLMSLLWAACDGGDKDDDAGSAETPEVSVPSATPTSPESEVEGVVPALPNPADEAAVADLVAGSEVVSFKGGAGDRVEGRMFGGGAEVGIVLAHGYSPEGGQFDWFPVAVALAEQGYAALTFNFTGFCPANDGLTAIGCSRGKLDATETWRDIEPAVDFMRAAGAETVFIVGSSMGGMAVMHSSARTDVEVAGAVAVGAPRRAPPEFPQTMNLTKKIVQGVDGPKLFMAGTGDKDPATTAKFMDAIASEPKELVLLESPAHASDLFVRAPAEISSQAMTALLNFLEVNASA